MIHGIYWPLRGLIYVGCLGEGCYMCAEEQQWRLKVQQQKSAARKPVRKNMTPDLPPLLPEGGAEKKAESGVKTCQTCGAQFERRFGFCPVDGTPLSFHVEQARHGLARPATSPQAESTAGETSTAPVKRSAAPESAVGATRSDGAEPVRHGRTPESLFTGRRFHGPCLPPPVDSKPVDLCESEDCGAVERLSEGFRNLTPEQQMQAKILAAKRKSPASADGEAQANGEQEQAGYVEKAEQTSSEAAT